MNEIPRPGEKYRHFKNKLYQIVAVATHSETGEKMVVYQALYGDYGVWVRPLSMFSEPVDRKKYSDAVQTYRFERVDLPEKEAARPEASGEAPLCKEAPLHPLFHRFLDAESFEERMELLNQMRGKVGRREAESLCLCLDIQPVGGSVEELLDHIRQCLRMQQRYDAPRLRQR